MGLTGDTRPPSQRRSGSNFTDDGNRVKALGSWISDAAAHVSAQVSQSIANAKTLPVASESGVEGGGKERRGSITPSIISLQRTSSVKSGISTPGVPASLAPSSIRPIPTNNAPSFAAAKATFTSLFSSKATPPSISKPEEDELCTLDLALALPPPTEDTSVKDLKDIHATAMASLLKFQKAYRSRAQQVQLLKQEAELRDEELEVEKLRSRTLKARIDGMATTICKEVALHEGLDTAVQFVGTGQEDRRESKTAEDAESNRNSVFSTTGSTDTPLTKTTTTTSSASSIYSASEISTTPMPASTSTHACDNCKGKTSSYAWLALSNVRTENQSLREKCRELEEGINDALEKLEGRK